VAGPILADQGHVDARMDLGQPLPAELLRRVSGGLAAYRNYPHPGSRWPWF
jgi:hypothetical protein